MPSAFPRSPRLLKGALVAFQSEFLGPIPNVIVFQYNPEQLSRTLADRAPRSAPRAVGSARAEAQRVMGPPIETINATVTLDAADQLEEPRLHPHVVAHGLHPALAALELLLYPPSGQVLLNQTLARAGEAYISKQGENVPLVLFVWGVSRVVPVRLTSFSVTEDAFDPLLNPIHATVTLGMQVLSYMELKETSIGYYAYLATQVQKEVLARLNLINSAEQVLSMLPVPGG